MKAPFESLHEATCFHLVFALAKQMGDYMVSCPMFVTQRVKERAHCPLFLKLWLRLNLSIPDS